MKAIINNKLYDTETAEFIGCYSDGYDMHNFHWFEEELYRKITGEYFICGSGGPLSPYQCQSDTYSGSYGYGSRIVPLSLDEAKHWVEQNLDADVYIGLFGPVEE